MISDSMFEFNICTEPGCDSTFAFSLYNAMTPGLGYKFCVEHINELAVKERLETDSMTSHKLFIFYIVARTSSNEMEQLAAWTSTGEHSTFTNAPTEVTRTSPILSKFSPATHILAAVEPKQAVTDLRM